MPERPGRILQASIEQVLQRSDLGDLAGGFTQLKRAGDELTGRCPFHDERTPSFWVNPTKGVYHCFGCGASGDVITFAQEKLGLDFVESIEYLADRYRVQLEYEQGSGGPRERRVSKRRLYELTESAAAYYHAHLLGSAAAAPTRAYLAERHVAEETIRAFRLGHSPEDGSLAAKARAKGFTREELTESRLITSNGRDFFRGRLMVPIFDRADRVLGFGARKLREDQFGGKYMNSADGPLFHKKETMFMAPALRAAAAERDELLVVEGYMDVIALWQAGFRNACAVMGTALTEQQVIELKRLAGRALFAFDPDAAGQVATLRALEQARKHDLDVRVVLLTDGDPADIVTGPDGRERMREILDESVPLLHYRVSALLGSADLGSEEGRERAWRLGLEFFAGMPDSPERKRQIDRFAFGLGLDSQAVSMLQQASGAARPLQEMRRHGGAGPERRPVHERLGPADRASGGAVVRPHTAPRLTAAMLKERHFLAAALIARERGNLDVASSPITPQHFLLEVHRRAWLDLSATDHKPLDVSRIHSDSELVGLVAELAAIGQRERMDAAGDGAAAVAAELESRLERQFLDRQIAELKERMTKTDGDTELLREKASLESRRQAVIARLRDAPLKE
jgi:DNA primase